MDITTSWNDEDLTSLAKIKNHKIVKDKDGCFIWMHNLGDGWAIHSIWVFEEYKKPASYLHYWLVMWRKELDQRQNKEIRYRTAINRKVRILKRSLKKDKADKIKELNVLLPFFTQQELANELGFSLSTVHRALSS